MSEFKFACPVCGQHMMCDSSQGGSVMECPTCFQKITAPQAPAADSKFILTGTKVSEKKISVRAAAAPVAAAEKPLPAKMFMLIALAACVVVAGIFFFIQRTHKSAPAETPLAATKITPPTNNPSVPKALAAPPANDTNWLLTLDEAVISDVPVAGRIHGQDFLAERAVYQTQNGVLILRQGTRGPVELGVQVNFSGAQPEALSGKTINVNTDAEKAAQVSLRWKDAAGVQKANYDVGYALRLEFGTLANNKLPGKIYLCTPDDQKSYLMGKFTAAVSRPKPKPAAPK